MAECEVKRERTIGALSTAAVRPDAPLIALWAIDPAAAQRLATWLGQAGMSLQRHADELPASFQQGGAPDLAILAASEELPPVLERIGRFRDRSDLPLLAVLPDGGAHERAQCLDAGADDCLSGAFESDELLARLRALLRTRYGSRPLPRRLGDLWLDASAREVRRNGRLVSLTHKEFDLLAFMVERPTEVISRQELMERFWPEAPGHEAVLEVAMSRLRAKLDRPGETRLIHTVRGIGYQIKPAAASAV